MNLPSSPIPVLDYLSLDYKELPLYLNITCEVLTAMERKSIKKDDFKKAYSLVKHWINVFELSNQELLTITAQTIKVEPIKKSVTGWMETVLHIKAEEAVSQKMSQEMSRMKAQERAKEVKRKKEEPAIDPYKLDEDQIRSNKVGWAVLNAALRKTKGVSDADTNE